MKGVRVRDLPPYPRVGEMLLCVKCAGEYSANRGDYFMDPPSEVVKHCGRPMRLVVRRTVYDEAS